jgi:transposase
MPKAYSEDMRAGVIAEVESGASRRAAAEEFDVSASTAIIWVKCFRETGRCTAKPRGGSVWRPFLVPVLVPLLVPVF